MLGQQLRDHFAVVGGLELAAFGLKFRAQRAVLTRLPLWATAISPTRESAGERLGIAEDAGTGGGVAGMADGADALQVFDGLFMEDLGDQTHVLCGYADVRPSETAMPALSWPRCWRANRPKKVMRATSSPGAKMPKTPHSSLGLSCSHSLSSGVTGEAATGLRVGSSFHQVGVMDVHGTVAPSHRATTGQCGEIVSAEASLSACCSVGPRARTVRSCGQNRVRSASGASAGHSQWKTFSLTRSELLWLPGDL